MADRNTYFQLRFLSLRKEEEKKKVKLTQSPCCVRILTYARHFSTFSRLTNFPETLLEQAAIVEFYILLTVHHVMILGKRPT